MNPLIAFAETATYDLTPPSLRLPSFLWTALTAINKAHGVWRWYRRAELYTNPNNFAQLLAGHALNLVIGDTLVVKIAAQCLLIATRVLECVQQQADVVKAGRSLLAAIKGNYSPAETVSWKTLSPNTIISPSTQYWARSTINAIIQRVDRIGRCVLTLLWESFALSMKILDTVDAFCLSPHTKNEGLNEGLVNAVKWLDALADNKEALLDGLTDNKAVIVRILEGSPLTFDSLRSGVERTLEKTEAVQKHAHQAAAFGNGVLIDMGKRIANGGMVAFGLADYRPVSLAPKS